jgi:hypothetical protein
MISELDEKLHKLLPSLQHAITVVTELHPETKHIFALVDEIWQLRTGISILGNTETIANPALQQESSVSFVSAEDAAIFAEINELWSPYHEITMEGDKGNDGNRIWKVAIPAIDYDGGVASSPEMLLRRLKVAIEVCNAEQGKRRDDPASKEAYSLAEQHNKSVEKHNEAVKERGGSPGEYQFEVTIEVHGLKWLVGIPVGENKWASTPDELLQVVKDQISYLETHQDEIRLLLGG